MKKILYLLLACAFVLSAASCGSGQVGTETSSETQNTQSTAPGTTRPAEDGQTSGSTKALIVFFSATGNTRKAAQALADITNADLYEIVPAQPYTEADLNYSDSSSRATLEQNDDTARPEISGAIPDISDYDVIYVGFPIWWGRMPRILFTFLDACDLSGKTIAPFCTSGGSGISAAVREIERLEPDAAVTDGLRVGNVSDPSDSLLEWLSRIGLSK